MPTLVLENLIHFISQQLFKASNLNIPSALPLVDEEFYKSATIELHIGALEQQSCFSKLSSSKSNKIGKKQTCSSRNPTRLGG